MSPTVLSLLISGILLRNFMYFYLTGNCDGDATSVEHIINATNGRERPENNEVETSRWLPEKLEIEQCHLSGTARKIPKSAIARNRSI